MSIVSDREVRTLVDRELPQVLESVPYARDLVVGSVPADVRRNAALVVSELVANAVKHGCGPVGLLVETDGRAVRIAVRDAGAAPRVDGSDGFGLQIVDRLARATGVDRDETGKTFWAEVAAT